MHLQPRQQKTAKAIFLGAVFLYWVSLYFYVPTLPVYVENRVGSLALVGVVLSMYGLWQAIIRLPVGIAADLLGRRKPFILVGLGLSAVGALILGHSAGFAGLAAGRAVTGLAAATWVPLVVMFSAMYKPEDALQATTILALVSSVSRMLATGLNGTLNDLGGYPLAFLLAAATAGLGILAILPVRETRIEGAGFSLREVKGVVTRRDVLVPALISAVSQHVAWTATFGFLPLLAEKLGASEVLLSMLTSMNIGVVLLGNLVVTSLVKRLGALPLLYMSVILSSVGVLLAALAGSLLLVFAAQFCLGLSFGIGSPLLMGKSIERVDNNQRATAMGLHQAVYAVGMFSGPWLSGLLAELTGIQPMFAITAGVSLVLALAGLRHMR